MRKYLAYLLKKRFPVYLSLLISFLAIFLIFTSKQIILAKRPYFNEWGFIEGYNYYVPETFCSVYYISLFIALTIVPFFEFGFKMHRISAEQAYSLPIKREQFYLSRYIIGFLEIIVPFIIAYLISLLAFTFWATEYIYIPALFGVLGILIIVAFIVYSIIVFLVCQANNVADSIVTLVLMTFSTYVLVAVIYYLFSADIDWRFKGYYGEAFHYYLYGIPDLVFKLSNLWLGYTYNFNIGPLPFIFWAVVGVASFVGFYFLSKNFKSENAGQRSESYFCYKVLVPLVSILTTIMYCRDINTIYYGVIILVATYFLFVTYRRSFKLNKVTWILFGSTALINFIVMALCASTV